MLVEVSFIIIEYHSLKDVLNCVKSMQDKCVNISYEIIISSNSTYEEPIQESLKLAHPKIKWSFNAKNNGFAYGMNCGISIAVGDFIILQNPDTSLENNKLIDVLNLMRKDKTIGLIGPKIINSKDEIQDSCRTFLTPSFLFVRIVKKILLKKASILEVNFDYNKPQSVNWVIGAFMIFSRQTIRKVGLLNEDFFMYVEDMDFCLRCWENNLKVIYYPALIIKYEGDRKSTNINFWRVNKYTWMHVKNYLLFLNKHGFKKIKKLSTISF